MTARRVVTSRQADDDIESALEYLLLAGRPETVRAFIDELQLLRDLLAEFPSIGSSRFALETHIPGLRDIAMKRFDYVMFYTDDDDAVRVHRLLHTSRDIPATLSGR
ncbi:type II toxin-antitoxin system RelE/ParE family toxin [Microbacterium sp. NPDC087665]|uniref:type II toxin-antitoxin system RelE/ParE family toxin n=1 Tax=Microbacterium sp. NPDC087665 TaxID=3364194 RepID=UPI00382A3314